ncbi:MFS transporter [Salinibaculum salinum]|uniref:MFS transporter n=1 Tax=Salinibaculum salinum TaxID=3131996 RepID=UPI0030ED6005
MTRFRDRQAALVVSLVGGSHVINHMYYILLPPVTTVAAADLGVGVARIGLAIGLLGAVVTALQLPFGHLSDTRGRTPMLALSLGFGAVGAILTATAQSYAWLLASQVVLGVGIAGHHPAHYPLLSAATDPGTRGRAFSVHGFTGALGFAATPAVVAGVVTLGYDWRVALGVVAALGAVYAVGCISVFVRFVDDEITAPSDTSHADESWTVSRVQALPKRAVGSLRGMLSDRGILLVTVLWLVTSIAGWGIKTQTLPLLTETYGLPEATGNTLVSAMFVVGAVLMFGGGWLTDRTSPGFVLVAGYVSLVAVTAALATGILPALLVVGLTLVLASTIDYSRPARATLADRFSSADDIGKSFGLVTIGISGGGAIAPPVLGWVSGRYGVEASFAVMGALGIVSLALTAVVLRVESARPARTPQPGDD